MKPKDNLTLNEMRGERQDWEGRFTVRNDYAFKIVFGSEESKEILPEFLSLVTDMDSAMFAEISIENPTLMPEYSDKKMGILDLTKVENDTTLGLLKNWLVFIRTNDRKEREEMAKTSTALERANELMERFYSDPEARRQYEAARKLEMDQWMFEEEFKRRGMEKGLQEGMKEGKRSTAQRMKQEHLAMDIIVRCTGLSEEEILQL